jgi:hypothetical protein
MYSLAHGASHSTDYSITDFVNSQYTSADGLILLDPSCNVYMLDGQHHVVKGSFPGLSLTLYASSGYSGKKKNHVPNRDMSIRFGNMFPTHPDFWVACQIEMSSWISASHDEVFIKTLPDVIHKSAFVSLWSAATADHQHLLHALSLYFAWFDSKMKTSKVAQDNQRSWIVIWACLLTFHLNTLHRLFANRMDLVHLSVQTLNSRWQTEYEHRIREPSLSDPTNFALCLKFLMYSCPICGRQPGCHEFCAKSSCNAQRGAATLGASKKSTAKGSTSDSATLSDNSLDYFAKNQHLIKVRRATVTHNTVM